LFDYINDYFVTVTCWSDQIFPLLTLCLHHPLLFSNWFNGNYAILMKPMLLISQGCLDFDVSENITTIKQKLRWYFPDNNIATDKTSIFDCVAECFTQGDHFIYYVSLIIIVVIWIPLHESSLRIVIYTVRQKLSTTWLASIIYFLIMNLFQIGLLFSLPENTYLHTCETGYWSIFIYVYKTGCVKCHVYFSTFVFANESWFFCVEF
jgi:hypothetical protein